MDKAYIEWIQELKQRICSSQIKAGLAVNAEMIALYWSIGKDISEKQDKFGWGSKIVEQMSKDLKRELPDTNGFSRTNLFAMRQFYLFYKDTEFIHQLGGQLNDNAKNNENTFVHQLGGQLNKEHLLCKIPWRHHTVILQHCKDVASAKFYIQQTTLNNWSRNMLEIQLDSKLIERQGKALNNFEVTLPKLHSDLAKETLKDPYKFDFLTLEADVQELDLEMQLIENITHFLLELGKGFAFVGRQYPLQIGDRERKIDLLFYHLKMHCYIVIDLKIGIFEPEYVGKMNYYLTAVDKQLKTDTDNSSIGIILCKSKNSIEVEYALQDMNKPMGVSEFTFNELPHNIQQNLPTVKELEVELKKLNNE
ncbi:MAG: PDDEXK nuclease domain-containing protein [Chitinophagales bacterium]|nr:PDDEXK nuclease domain-containing protein [Chitinophagales bacterium]MCZ2394484.1 PDDEXK nuclease domain-containing protein [Chitinophagales bacterium]